MSAEPLHPNDPAELVIAEAEAIVAAEFIHAKDEGEAAKLLILSQEEIAYRELARQRLQALNEEHKRKTGIHIGMGAAAMGTLIVTVAANWEEFVAPAEYAGTARLTGAVLFFSGLVIAGTNYLEKFKRS